ncbi:MAG: hypothetical protein ACTSYF_02085 [Promethearchaeota archaeon]
MINPITEENRLTQLRQARKNNPGAAETDRIPQQHSQISSFEAGLMLVVALIFDGIQAITKLLHFIPIIGNTMAIMINWLVDIFAWLTFYVWLKSKGMKARKGSFLIEKAPIVLGGGLLLEVILSALPAWTAAIIIIIFKERGKKVLRYATNY